MNKKYAGATRSTHPRTVGPDYTVSDPHPETTTDNTRSFGVSKEMQEGAKEIIEKGFRAFVDHSQNLADELAEYDTMREEVRREISRGARRTSGRII